MTAIDIETEDGRCPAHVFRPEDAGPWPGVLFFMDGIGMRPALIEMAQRLASSGYHVLMPDLFWRAGAYTAPDPKALFSDEAVRNAHFAKFRPAGSPNLILKDTRAFLAHFEQKRIGVVGYCMGGRMALVAAATFGERIAAAAAFHPGQIPADLAADKIRARVYVAGAMEDQTFTDEQKTQLDKQLTAAGVDHVVETYPARHGWVPSDTPVHDAACAERHWKELLSLLSGTLNAA